MVIELPVKVMVTKKRAFRLNLNDYRNAHFQVLSKAKRLFADEVKPLIPNIIFARPIKLTYTLFTATRCDIANILTVADKFFLDAFVTNGNIVDDNWQYVQQVTYKHEYSKVKRIEVHIEQI